MFWTNLTINVLLVIYVIDCLFMGLVIMMQRSKQEGLGAAFGSGMMSDTFGAQTSQVLVKATVWAAIIFFVLSITLARLYSNRAAMVEKGSAVQLELSKPVAPPATNAPSAMVPSASPTSAAPVSTPVTPSSAPASTQPAPAKPSDR